MASLSEKRALYHQYLRGSNKNELDNIDVNTDEVEEKLDTIITNTNHNSVTGTMDATLIAGGVVNSSTIDIGINSGIYKFQWAGTESNQHVDYVIHTSNDGITFHPYPSAVALKINGYISIEYDIVFRYHKLIATNTHASQGTTLALVFSGRH